MKIAAVAVIFFALAFAAPAGAVNLGAPIDLEAAISDTAGHPIDITVNTELPGSWAGGAWEGLPYIYIGRDAYTDAQRGGGQGVMVLLHELGHTTGIHGEGAANCFALAHVMPFLRAHWHVETFDAWAHAFDPVMVRYDAAVASMLQQSAVYQCGAA